jgi:YhcN/YlaJ family sporulation lipoprotein
MKTKLYNNFTFNSLSINNKSDFHNKIKNDTINDIKQTIKELKGISDCHIILSGSIAIVGLNLESDMDDKNITNLKKETENIVRNMNTNIKTVSITTSTDLINRIDKLEKGYLEPLPPLI